MANQYQNTEFSGTSAASPVIIPDQKYGWEAANSSLSGAIKSATDYLTKQHQNIQDLQMEQAKDLMKFKTLDQVYYGGQHSDMIDSALSTNPYGSAFVSKNKGLAQSGGQPQGAPMGGIANGANYIGMGGGGQPSPGSSVMPNPYDQSQPNTGGAPMSAMAPGNEPVVTEQSTTQKAFEPPSYTTKTANPAGEAVVAGAKEFSGKMAGEEASAQAGTAKDNQQLAMVKNALKPLVQSYEDVYNSKVVGVLPAGGDMYGSSIVKNADWLPRGVQNSIVPPETQTAAGKFLSNKNELIVKLQPLLSQQFGKDGSSRIMESLINMSQNEIGDLNTPRAQFHGQITGTIGSLYRIAKAAQAYKQDLVTSGQTPPTPEAAAQEISRRMNMQTLSPAEQKEMQGLVDDTLGNKKEAGGSQNPVMNQQGTKQSQLDHATARQILQQAGGDKNKARQMAKQMGYSL